MRILYLFMTLFVTISCQKDIELKDGDTVIRIERNIVTGINGESLKLSNGINDRTYYLFRHAEKDTFPKSNPVLNNVGYERSYKIADIFRKTKVDRIYSTFYNRTIHTVDSLAAAKGLETTIYTPRKLKDLSEQIRTDSLNKNCVIVGHSNTIPGMINLLMGKQVITEAIDEMEYNNFYIIDVKEGTEPVLHRLKF